MVISCSLAGTGGISSSYTVLERAKISTQHACLLCSLHHSHSSNPFLCLLVPNLGCNMSLNSCYPPSGPANQRMVKSTQNKKGKNKQTNKKRAKNIEYPQLELTHKDHFLAPHKTTHKSDRVSVSFVQTLLELQKYRFLEEILPARSTTSFPEKGEPFPGIQHDPPHHSSVPFPWVLPQPSERYQSCLSAPPPDEAIRPSVSSLG